jgi:hypothetical protein
VISRSGVQKILNRHGLAGAAIALAQLTGAGPG